MSDWMIIRVVLIGRRAEPLANPPGRRLLAHADHAFADLADAIDAAFGRWDLSPLHRFDVDGRVLTVLDAGLARDEDAEDSAEVTLGEAGLRLGAAFSYLFDLDEGWRHDCLVEAVDADPDDLLDDEPDLPTPVDGWGVLPDQYGRLTDDEGIGEDADEADADDEATEGADEDEAEDELEWAAAVAASRQAVVRALGEPEPADAPAALREVVAALRGAGPASGEPGAGVLHAAAGITPDEEPEDDEDLWLLLAAGVVAPEQDVPLDDDAVGAWTALEPGDWAAAVIELVRSGPGTPTDPEALLDLIARCPDVETAELGEEDEALVLDGFEVVAALWRSLGVVDAEGGLTELGVWGLPRALETAWAPLERG